MKKHHLYEVDLERLGTFCTVCGYTEIILPKSRSNTATKPLCVARAKELQEKQLKKDVNLNSKFEAWENFYNYNRPHMSHDEKTLYEVMKSLLLSCFSLMG